MSKKTKTHSVGIVWKCTALALAAGILCSPQLRAQSSTPKYEVDLYWPKPFPNQWILGGLGGVCVDAQDHVFLLNLSLIHI